MFAPSIPFNYLHLLFQVCSNSRVSSCLPIRLFITCTIYFLCFVFIYNVVRSSVIFGGSEDEALHALKRQRLKHGLVRYGLINGLISTGFVKYGIINLFVCLPTGSKRDKMSIIVAVLLLQFIMKLTIPVNTSLSTIMLCS